MAFTDATSSAGTARTCCKAQRHPARSRFEGCGVGQHGGADGHQLVKLNGTQKSVFTSPWWPRWVVTHTTCPVGCVPCEVTQVCSGLSRGTLCRMLCVSPGCQKAMVCRWGRYRVLAASVMCCAQCNFHGGTTLPSRPPTRALLHMPCGRQRCNSSLPGVAVRQWLAGAALAVCHDLEQALAPRVMCGLCAVLGCPR